MSAPLSGQVAVTGTAQQIATSSPKAFTLKAAKGNANPVYIGPSGVTVTTGHELDAGEVFSYERSSNHGAVAYEVSLPELYVVGTAGSDRVTWFGSP